MSKQEKYKSNLIGSLLSEMSSTESEKIRNRMLLAAKIEDKMNSLKIKKSEFAELIGKQPSVITKWFSGTHNFTVDTLWDIEHILNLSLVNLKEEKSETKIVLQTNVSSRGSFRHDSKKVHFSESIFSSEGFISYQNQLTRNLSSNVTNC